MARRPEPGESGAARWRGRWRWPLTLGLLPGADVGERLEEIRLKHAFQRRLAKAVALGPAEKYCEILALPDGLEGLNAPLLAGKAAALLVFGKPPSAAELEKQLRKWRAGAISFVDTDSAEMPAFLHRLVYELSHNVPYAEAVARVAPSEPRTVTLPGFRDRAVLRSSLDDSLSRLGRLETPIHVPRAVSDTMGISLSPTTSAGEVRTQIAASKSVIPYLHEGDGATGVARLETAIQEAETGAAERYADPRFYGSEDGEPGEPVKPDERLALGTPYVLGFALRTQRIGIGMDAPTRPTRVKSKNKEKLLVAIAAGPDCEIAFGDQVQSVDLPPEGDSTEALFEVTVKSGACVSIDLRVYYNLNLLEHVRVESRLQGGAFPDGSFHRLEQLSQFESYSGDLADARPPVDLAIDIRRDGETATMALSSPKRRGVALKISLPITMRDLIAELDRLRSLWLEVGLGAFGTGVAAASAADARAALFELAKTGRRLWSLLFEHGYRGGGADAIGAALRARPLPDGATVQVSVPEGVHAFAFPWALLYDGAAPAGPRDVDARAFWGARYVIEQRATGVRPRRKAPRTRPHGVKLFVNQSIGQIAGHLSALRQLAAASESAFSLDDELAESNAAFKADLAAGGAPLLYFFCHAVTAFPNALLDELQRQAARASGSNGNFKWLSAGKLAESDSSIRLTKGKLELGSMWHLDGEYRDDPLVILNMCESAQVMPELSNSFVHFFLTRNAGAVLGTDCPVPPELAAHVGETLLAKLAAGAEIGAALLAVRQALLADHQSPMGLAYSLWGTSKATF